MLSPMLKRYPRFFSLSSRVVHILGAAHFIFGCYYDWFVLDIPKEVAPIFSAYGYKLKFLTFWNALVQMLYFIVCVVNDMSGPNNKKPTALTKIKDYIEAAIAFPIGIYVVVTFWSLMLMDRELLLPASLDPHFPNWFVHFMHTHVIVYQLLEVTTSRRDYPNKILGLLGLSVFQIAYIVWMFYVYERSGLWTYPIFNVINLPAKIAFLTASFFLGYLFYFVGEHINTFLWGNSGKTVSDGRKKKR